MTTERAEHDPLPPLPDLLQVVGSLGFRVPHWTGTTTVRQASSDSDLGLCALVAVLEETLPEPFPEDLLESVDTLDDLYGFALVKASRNVGSRP